MGERSRRWQLCGVAWASEAAVAQVLEERQKAWERELAEPAAGLQWQAAAGGPARPAPSKPAATGAAAAAGQAATGGRQPG